MLYMDTFPIYDYGVVAVAARLAVTWTSTKKEAPAAGGRKMALVLFMLRDGDSPLARPSS
jgi:hypothetical protein